MTKKLKMKKVFWLFGALTFFLVFIILPGKAWAATGDTFIDGNLKYSDNGDGTATVTGLKSDLDAEGKLIIPAEVTYNGQTYKVTAIDIIESRGKSSIKQIVFPDTLTSIGEYAFSGCWGLEGELVFPESLKSIGRSAFSSGSTKQSDEQSNQITSVKLPAGLETLENGAFSGCRFLKSVELNNSLTRINYATFQNCCRLEQINFPDGLQEIGGYAFWGCSALPQLALPDSLQLIEANAFSKCSGLTELKLPENLTTINRGAFSSCTGLQTITFNENLQTIESNAFQNCTGLTVVEVPATVTNVAAGAFNGALGTIKVHNVELYAALLNYKPYNNAPPQNYTVEFVGSLQNAIFEDGGYRYIILDDESVQLMGLVDESAKPSGVLDLPSRASYLGRDYTVTGISVKAFSGCEEITGINFPTNLTDIGYGAFEACKGLTNIDLPDSVKSIGDYAFVSCNNLTKVEWPENLETIGKGAFNACSLVSVVLPDNVKKIGEGVFYNCTALEKVVLPSGLESLDEDAFAFCTNLQSVNLPAALENMGALVFYNCSSLQEVVVAEDIKLTEIPDYSFGACSALEKINIPDSITKIDEGAFSGCTRLQDLTLSKNLTSIEQGAFASCASLAEGIVLTGDKLLNNIGSKAFDDVPLIKCDTADMYDYLKRLVGENTQVWLLYKLEDVTVSCNPTEYVYTGQAFTPEVTVTCVTNGNTVTFELGRDYTVAYKDNVEIGTATVIVTRTESGLLIGNKTKEVTFKIVEPDPEPTDPTDPDPTEPEPTDPEPTEPTDPEPPVVEPEYCQVFFELKGGVLPEGITNPAQVKIGEEYPLPLPVRDGYTMQHWAIGAEDSANTVKANEVYTFTADTTVYAIWQQDPVVPPVKPSTSSGGSSRRPSKPAVTQPEQTKPEDPQPDNNNSKSPQNVTTIFPDLTPGAWYIEAVEYMYRRGLMQGNAEGTFAPNYSTTRGQIVTILYRLAISENPNLALGEIGFGDVGRNKYYTEAISWAELNGIVKGYSSSIFAPDDLVTREQLAAILWRYAGSPEVNFALTFTDSEKIGDWALQAVQWAAAEGIVIGNENNVFAPQSAATRAEVAMMLMRYLEK